MWQKLMKTNIKRCKTTCRFELDIGPGARESAVEFDSTLDYEGLIIILMIIIIIIKQVFLFEKERVRDEVPEAFYTNQFSADLMTFFVICIPAGETPKYSK
jgi:hypothetical protein